MRRETAYGSAAAGWFAGTLCLHQLPALPAASWWVPLGLAAMLALETRARRWLVWGILGFLWSTLCAQARLDDRLAPALEGRDLAVSGWVDGFPIAREGRVTFPFRVEAGAEGVPQRLRLTWYTPPTARDGGSAANAGAQSPPTARDGGSAANAGAQSPPTAKDGGSAAIAGAQSPPTAKDGGSAANAGAQSSPTEIEAGAELSLQVRLRRPRGLANRGGFDYERWLFLEGYGASGYVRSARSQPVASARVERWWLGVRRELAQRIGEGAASADAAAVLTALTLGERFRFSREHWSGLQRTGTSHLFAISGLHVGLVATLVFFVVRRLWLRCPHRIVHYDLEAAACSSLAAGAGYAALAGFTVPTQRALVMLAVALAALVSRRSIGVLNALAAALLFVLIWDPFAPLSISFWLSFSAVSVLLAFGVRRRLGAPQRRSTRALRSLAGVQWALTLTLAPLIILFFGQLSLVSPLVNLAAVPFFSLALVPLSLSAAVALTLTGHGGPLLHAAGALADGAWTALAAISAQPWAAVELPQPAPRVLALALAGALAVVLGRPLPGRRVACLALLPLVPGGDQGPPAGSLRATVLDVGHGLSVLVETREHVLIYDAGPRYPSGFDTGREIVLPALAALGRDEIDVLILSHADNDHSGGAEAVLQAHPRARVLAGPDVSRAGVRACQAGERWVWNRVAFEILHPPPGFPSRGNESSCVLKVSTAAGALLIPGDIEGRAEASLQRERTDLAARVIVVPHHGSATSSSTSFVQSVRPELAVVSAAFANRWGFPRPEVRQRWAEGGARLVVTADAGAVTVELRGDGALELSSERARGVRYWHPARHALPGESREGAL